MGFTAYFEIRIYAESDRTMKQKKEEEDNREKVGVLMTGLTKQGCFHSLSLPKSFCRI